MNHRRRRRRRRRFFILSSPFSLYDPVRQAARFLAKGRHSRRHSGGQHRRSGKSSRSLARSHFDSPADPTHTIDGERDLLAGAGGAEKEGKKVVHVGWFVGSGRGAATRAKLAFRQMESAFTRLKEISLSLSPHLRLRAIDHTLLHSYYSPAPLSVWKQGNQNNIISMQMRLMRALGGSKGGMVGGWRDYVC